MGGLNTLFLFLSLSLSLSPFISSHSLSLAKGQGTRFLSPLRLNPLNGPRRAWHSESSRVRPRRFLGPPSSSSNDPRKISEPTLGPRSAGHSASCSPDEQLVIFRSDLEGLIATPIPWILRSVWTAAMNTLYSG